MKFPCARRATRRRVGMWLVLCLVVPACGPSDPVAELRRQQAAGDAAGTLDPLRELVDQHPDNAEVYFLYGRALAATGQPSLAEWPLRKAMEDPEWLMPAGLQLAAGELETRNFDAAIKVTTQLLEVDPDNLQILLMRANARAYSKRYREDALADVDRILELDPDATDALEPRIVALLGLERIEEAAQAIEDLGARIEETQLSAGTRGWHCATTALFADANGDIELARERWADCLERFPDHPNVIQNAVKFYDGQGEVERSIEILLAALEKAPESRDHRMMAAERLRMVGRPEQALALLQQATEQATPQLAAVAWTDVAAFHASRGDAQAEVAAAGRALELARQVGRPHPQLLLVYADAALRAGQLEEALAAANEIELPAYRVLLRGRVAQAQDRPGEAAKLYEEAARLWPDNSFARYYEALAYEALGEFDRAIEAYRYAIRISPADTDARLRVARLLAAQGRFREALTLINVKHQEFPPGLEAELLAVRLAARLGEVQTLQLSLQRIGSASPNLLGLAAAHAARGLWGRAGPVAALGVLRGIEGVDLLDPQHADALRAIVRYSQQAGQLDEARADVAAALAAHPDSAAFHEIEALLLDVEGAPREQVRAAYERALALEPENPWALAGLARLALASDPEGALAYFERAAGSRQADPDLRRAVARGAADALVALGRSAEAEERLRALLLEYPYHAEAAAALAEIELERGSPSDRTLELAQRATHFGGGADAFDLLARVHRERGESEQATEAAARAQALRDARRPGSDDPVDTPAGDTG